jgi:hypothetical protein
MGMLVVVKICPPFKNITSELSETHAAFNIINKFNMYLKIEDDIVKEIKSFKSSKGGFVVFFLSSLTCCFHCYIKFLRHNAT